MNRAYFPVIPNIKKGCFLLCKKCKEISFLVPFLFFSNLYSQEVINFCPTKSGINHCHNLDQLKKECEEEYKRLEKINKKKLKGADLNMYQNLPKSMEDISTLNKKISSFNSSDIDIIVSICDKILMGNYLAKNGSSGNKEISKIIPEIKRLALAQKDGLNNQKTHINTEFNNDQSEIKKAIDSESKINNKDNVLESKESQDSTLDKMDDENLNNKMAGYSMWYLIPIFLIITLIIFLSKPIYFYAKKIIMKSKQNNDNEIIIDNSENNENKVNNIEEKYQQLKTNYDAALIKIHELEIKNTKLTQELLDKNYKDESKISYNTPNVEIYPQNEQLNFNTLYHHDIEYDNRSLRISKSTLQKTAMSKYELRVTGNKMHLFLIESNDVTKSMIDYSKDQLEPFFEIPKPPTVEIQLIKTVLPAKFFKDGEYWILEDDGKGTVKYII